MWSFKKTTVVWGAVLGFFLGFICFDAALAAPIISFEASPSVIPVNSSTTLNWTVTDAVSCTASGEWSGAKDSASGSEGTGNLTAGMKTFTLTCENALFESTAVDVIVTVANPPTLDFLPVGGSSIIEYNTSLNLSWSSTNANSCEKFGDWVGATTLTGNDPTGNLISEKTFGIRCTGDGGIIDKTITVIISNPALQVELIFFADNYFLNWEEKANLHWIATNADSCTASNAWAGAKSSIAGDFESPELQSDKVYTLYCSNSSGSSVTKHVSIFVAPKIPIQVVTTATTPDANIEYNTAATIEWTSTDATHCRIRDGVWSGNLPTAHTYVSGNLLNDRTFIVRCYGDLNDDDTVAINVAPNPASPPTLLFSPDANPIAYDTGTDLNWTATDTTTLTASGSWGGNKTIPTGTQATGNLLMDTTYGLTATGPGGNITQNVGVTVGDPVSPPTVTVWADNSIIAYNEITTIRWTSADASWCRFKYDAVDMIVGANGNRSTGNLIAGKTYEVECGNAAGSTPKTTTVTVTPTGIPPVIMISADDNPVAYGAGTIVRWTTANAVSCSLSGVGNVPVNSSRATGALYASRTYTLSCIGPGGFNSDSVTVNVTGAPVTPPILTFWADEYTFYGNGSTTLHWDATNADSCWASGGPWNGNKAVPTGSEGTINLISTTFYQISCQNVNGTVSDSLTITVDDANDVEIEFYADNTNIEINGSVNLTWNGKNANVCKSYSSPVVLGWPWIGNQTADQETSTTAGPFTSYNTTLWLNCWNYTSNKWASFTITAGDPPPSITMNAPTPVAYNTPATIAWFADYAESCTASSFPAEPTWSGSRAVSGLQQTSNLKQHTTFSLDCVNAEGVTRSTSKLVKVGSSNLTAPQVSFTSDKYIATEGENYNVSWSVANATWCSASSDPNGLWGGGKNNIAGAEPLIFSGDKQELVLTCGSAAGSMSSIVTVNKGGTELTIPNISFWADQMAVPVGGQTMLRWSTENADTCSATSVPATSWTGAKAAGSGQQQTDILNVSTRFELTCQNAAGARIAVVNINVGGSLPGVIINFNASRYDVSAGKSTTLSWTAENASYCYGMDPNVGFVGGKSMPSGSETLSPIVSTVYKLVCGNDGGEVIATIPITVAKVIVCPNPARIINLGNTIQLTAWFKQDADVAFSCSNTSGAIDITNGYDGFSTDWDSADNAVVTVSANGLATGLDYTDLHGGSILVNAEYKETEGDTDVIVSAPPITCWKCSESRTCFSEITFPISGNCPDETFDTMHECAKSCRKPVDWQEVGS